MYVYVSEMKANKKVKGEKAKADTGTVIPMNPQHHCIRSANRSGLHQQGTHILESLILYLRCIVY